MGGTRFGIDLQEEWNDAELWTIRRDVLQSLAAVPLIALLAQAREVAAEPAGSPCEPCQSEFYD
jgi:hypothetical protein